MNLELNIFGITCISCVNSIKSSVRDLGIRHVDLQVPPPERDPEDPVLASISMEPGLKIQDICRKIEDAGFEISSTVRINISQEYFESSFPNLAKLKESNLLETRRENDRIILNIDKETIASNETLDCLFPDEKTRSKMNNIRTRFLELNSEEHLIENSKSPRDLMKAESPKLEKNSIENNGYSEAIVNITIKGMTCASCVKSIESSLRRVDGILKVHVALLTERAEIIYSTHKIKKTQILDLINDLGFIAKERDLLPSDIITVDFLVEGMTCSSCSRGIENEISKLNGVEEVKVALVTNRARVKINQNVLSAREVGTKIEDLGFKPSIIRDNSDIQRKSLEKSEEILEWKSELFKSLWFFVPEFLISHVLPHITVTRSLLATKFIIPGLHIGSIIELLLTIPVQFIIGRRFYVASWKALSHGNATMDVLIALGTTCAFVFSLYSLVYSIYLGHTSNIPKTFFDTSTMLITFVLIGKYFESIAKGKTSTALANLYTLKDVNARIVEEKNGIFVESASIPIEYIQVGELMKILPGESIPTDGVVVYGEGYIDESFITGESIPIHKKIGYEVIGGTINQSNSGNRYETESQLVVKATKVGKDTALSQVIKLVEDAQSSKPPIQNFSDKVATYFVPIIVSLAILTFVSWMAILNGIAFEDLPDYIKRLILENNKVFHLSNTYFALKMAISVVVVACPCALGLATPTAIMVGTGVGASLGILIKNGPALEIASGVKKVIFDKTGTITSDKLGLKKLEISKNSARISEKLLYTIVATCQTNSTHPIALSLQEFAKEMKNVSPERFECEKEEDCEFLDVEGPREFSLKITDFNAKIGSGIRCNIKFEDKRGIQREISISMGNESYLGKEISTLSSKYAVDGSHTTVFFEICLPRTQNHSMKAHPLIEGVFSFDSEIKPEAKAVIEYLRRNNIESYLVTGDQWETALSVSRKIGIADSNVFAGVTPGGKLSIVKSLKEGTEIMVGRNHEFEQLEIEEDDSQIGISFLESIWRFWKRKTQPRYSKVQRSKNIVAMIGDGINDSPALAEADVGIALCSGTEIAMDTADVVLIGHSTQYQTENKRRVDLWLIPTAIDLAKNILRRIMYNFMWATAYNVITVPIAMGLLIPFGISINPVIAAGMMAMSSLSVLFSSLLLRKYRPPQKEAVSNSELNENIVLWVGDDSAETNPLIE